MHKHLPRTRRKNRRVTYSKLNVVLAQKHGVASHRDYSTLGRDSGAGRALGKQQGDRLAGEGACEGLGRAPSLDVTLGDGGAGDEGGQLPRGEVRDGQEVAGRLLRHLLGRNNEGSVGREFDGVCGSTEGGFAE